MVHVPAIELGDFIVETNLSLHISSKEATLGGDVEIQDQGNTHYETEEMGEREILTPKQIYNNYIRKYLKHRGYYLLVLSLYITITVLAVLDRFQWNISPRQGFALKEGWEICGKPKVLS